MDGNNKGPEKKPQSQHALNTTPSSFAFGRFQKMPLKISEPAIYMFVYIYINLAGSYGSHICLLTPDEGQAHPMPMIPPAFKYFDGAEASAMPRASRYRDVRASQSLLRGTTLGPNNEN